MVDTVLDFIAYGHISRQDALIKTTRTIPSMGIGVLPYVMGGRIVSPLFGPGLYKTDTTTS
jgi:hypothetical protein